MTRIHRTTRRRRLAICIAAALALTAFAPACLANYDNVLNCNDTGAGSLRDTIANATSGDTVVLNPTNMNCSVVTLGAEIAIAQNLSLDEVQPNRDAGVVQLFQSIASHQSFPRIH